MRKSAENGPSTSATLDFQLDIESRQILMLTWWYFLGSIRTVAWVRHNTKYI